MKRLRHLIVMMLLLGGCASAPTALSPQDGLPDTVMRRPFILWPSGEPLPTQGYDRAPQVAFDPSDLFIQPDEMRPFYGPPGEFGYYIDGANYGFQSLSFILTETHPAGGPDLHRHKTEEAHILFDGRVTYFIGDSLLEFQPGCPIHS